MGTQLACPGLEVSREGESLSSGGPTLGSKELVPARVPDGAGGPGERRTKGGGGFGRHGRQKDLAGAWGWWGTIKGPPAAPQAGLPVDVTGWCGRINSETKLPLRQAPICGSFESLSCLNSKFFGHGITAGALGEFKKFIS